MCNNGFEMKFKDQLRNIVHATIAYRGKVPHCEACIDNITEKLLTKLKGEKDSKLVVDALEVEILAYEELFDAPHC